MSTAAGRSAPSGAPSDALGMMRRLYPGAAVAGAPAEAGRERRFLALPTAERARMFLPAEPRLAALALRNARRPVGRRDRLVTAGASAALRAGAGRALSSRCTVVTAGPSVDDVLADVLGQPVLTGVFLGPPRANRKPVVQVLDLRGRLLAVAKVGVSPLAAELGRAEAQALRVLEGAALRHVVVPRLLAETQWDGLPVVVQSALPVWQQGGDPDPDAVTGAAREIATCLGVERAAWGASGYRAGLLARVEALPDGPVRDALREILTRVPDELELEHGAWHGDFSAFNVAQSGAAGLLVWDWERFERRVPVGFDLLHHHFMPLLRRGAAAQPDPAGALLDDAPRLLSPFGTGPESAVAVATAYLAEIATRFTTDRQAAAGGAGGDVARWLLQLLDPRPTPDPRRTRG